MKNIGCFWHIVAKLLLLQAYSPALKQQDIIIITIPYSDKLILAANNMVAIAPPDFRK